MEKKGEICKQCKYANNRFYMQIIVTLTRGHEKLILRK